jgi:hypothetical protein
MDDFCKIQFKIDGQQEAEKLGLRLHANGNLELITNDNSQAQIIDAEHNVFYRGENKTRIRQRRFLDSKNPNFHEIEVYAKYDRIWVIDTNYNHNEKIDGNSCAYLVL